MNHICPVCGYDGLQQAPYDTDGNESFEICDCCGFEIGFDDIREGHTFESYRTKWMSAGATWFYKQSQFNTTRQQRCLIGCCFSLK